MAANNRNICLSNFLYDTAHLVKFTIVTAESRLNKVSTVCYKQFLDTVELNPTALRVAKLYRVLAVLSAI